jgi:hypothetical protein
MARIVGQVLVPQPLVPSRDSLDAREIMLATSESRGAIFDGATMSRLKDPVFQETLQPTVRVNHINPSDKDIQFWRHLRRGSPDFGG